jgi:hypothetical protein
MRILMGGAALFALGLSLAGCGDSGVSGAKAAEAAPAAESVTAVGCPKAPKPECLTLVADGKTYDVTAAGIDVSRGVAVSVTGMTGAPGACGPTLTQAQVEYTGLQCKH